MMPRKQITSSSTPINNIVTLQSCIADYEAKLNKIYKQSLTALQKHRGQAKAMSAKLRVKLATEKSKLKKAKAKQRTQPTRPNQDRVTKAQATTIKVQSLLSKQQETEKQLTEQSNEIMTHFKKFVAQQKAVIQFEKAWKHQLVKPQRKSSKAKLRKKHTA